MTDRVQASEMSDHRLNALLRPTVIAVVGVSSDPSKLGSAALRNIVHNRFPGRVYAVARQRLEAYPSVTVVNSLEEIVETIDVALFALPATDLLSAIRSAPHSKIRLAVAIAAGFSETGRDGRILEDDLRDYCATIGLPLVGVNCQGVVVPGADLQMTFSPMFNDMVSGPVAVIAQSGALGAYMANRLMRNGTGIRCFVSSGNETCLEAADYIELLAADAQTSVILCYLEQLRSGTHFASAIRSLPATKRVVIVKSGRTSAGVRAAATHTGAIASDDEVISGVFRQLGVLRVHDSATAVDAASALAAGRTLPGRRIGVLSIAGGLAVELTDLLETGGFEVPAFSQDMQERLRHIVPTFGAVANPIDLTGAVLADGRKFRDALDVLSTADVDGFAIISTYVSDPEYAHAIVKLFRGTNKPVIVCWTGTVEQTPEALRILGAAKVPIFDNTRRTASAFKSLLLDVPRVSADDKEHPAGVPLRSPSELRATVRSWVAVGRAGVHEFDAKALLARAGLPVPRQTGYEGASVVKFCADTHLHKTDYGLVRLNVQSSELTTAREELAEQGRVVGASFGVVLVEEHITDGLFEWFVGFKRDPTFGPVVVLGAGGIFAEAMPSPQIRLAPLRPFEASQLIRSHPAYSSIAGGRRRAPGNLEDFAQVICNVSEFFAMNVDLISEIDLNPIIVRPAYVAQRGESSVVIIDAAITLNGMPANG